MTQKPDLKRIGALIGVALIWGTTYLGIRVAVETIPRPHRSGFLEPEAFGRSYLFSHVWSCICLFLLPLCLIILGVFITNFKMRKIQVVFVII